MKLPAVGAIVLIEWLDACSTGSGWRARYEVEEDELSRCRSVGWVVSVDRVRVVIASSEVTQRDKSEASVTGGIVIPSACIKTIKRLR